MIQDAVSVFAKSFDDVPDFVETFEMVKTACDKYKFDGYKPNESGKEILNRVDTVNKSLK